MKALVAYFSAQGKTAKIAREFAESIGADLCEITPEIPYSSADILWVNPLARCNREKIMKKDVPVKTQVSNFEQYDTVYLGFPIWYGSAPNVVNTFCKGCRWDGKKVHAFATSGGGGLGKTAQKLEPYVSGAVSVDAKLVKSTAELQEWAKNLL